MVSQKGSNLEELVRAFFAKQGYYCLRGVSYRFDEEDVTDIDVWLYGKQGASVRTRAIDDVKNKKSPRVFERVLWTRGMQLALGCDRAMVATTSVDPKVARFATEQKVALLTKSFLSHLEGGLATGGRLTREQFVSRLREYSGSKQDGDWIKIIEGTRSALVSTHGFAAFNRSMAALKFFGQRLEARAQNTEQALRCALLMASVGCIGLDSSLSRVFYEEPATRHRFITNGVTYGDPGDGRTQSSINMVLELMAQRMPGGRALSAQTKDAFDGIFAGVRSEIIAEAFSKDASAAILFRVARELDDLAHAADLDVGSLSIDAKTVLGVFADFCDFRRSLLIAPGSSQLTALLDSASASATEVAQDKLI